MEKLQTIDTADFEKFFKENYSGLCQYAYKFLRDEFEAEEVVQQFFIRLWDGRNQLQVDFLGGYAYRAVRNSCLNHILRGGKLQREPIDNLVNTIVENMDWDGGEGYVYQSQVRKAILKIPRKSRRILLLHCIRGLKYKEIADLLNISINTVKSQIAVAYRILIDELKDLFPLFLLSMCLQHMLNMDLFIV